MSVLPKGTSPGRRLFLGGAAATVGLLALRRIRSVAAQPPAVTSPEDLKRIEAAIPAKAFVTPRKPRRLLIFDLNVGYGGHGSIATANTAFTLMGVRTGAFETVVSRDPAVFESDSLKHFDAVFFNNTVGNCFDDPTLRQNLAEFVYSGGGLMGVHGTSVAFTKWPGAIEDWPEFGLMIGARGANHRAPDEHVFIKLDDPTHPVNQVFGGQGFDYRDEFFRVHEPYSRDRVRVLLSIDTEKTDLQQGPGYGKLERADNDFALAWVRGYGRGRVFYCGFAHNPYVFWDPKMLQFYLAATQFALGDLPAPTTPSARLTPAVRAQEQLGWRVCLTPAPSAGLTLFESIEKAAELGVLYIGACNRQKVSRDIPKDFDDQLTGKEREQIRLKLDSAGVRLLTYRTDPFPSDPTEQRKVFDFARRMGASMSVSDDEQLRMDPSLRESAPLDKAAIETMEAMEKEGRSPLDKVFRRGPDNPNAIHVELTDGGVDSMAKAAQHIQLVNNTALRMATGG
jgi:type 1 glutamine amidotransferase